MRTADLIVDCVPDELESKLEIFSLLDRMAPPLAIFVTPTGRLSIADLASCTYRADRCIAIQFASKDLLAGETVVLVSTTPDFARGAGRSGEILDSLGFRTELKLDPAEPRSRREHYSELAASNRVAGTYLTFLT